MTEQLRSATDQLEAAWKNYSEACLALQPNPTQSHVLGFSPELARSLDAKWAFVSSFSAKVEQTKFAIRRARNYSSGIALINALPREVLTRIFQFVLDERCQHDQLWIHRYDGNCKALRYADDLAQVCFLWRQIAISCSFLWNHIDLTQADKWHQRLIYRADVYTDRTGLVPVELHVADEYDYEEKDQDYDSLYRLLYRIARIVGTLEIAINGAFGDFHRTLFHALFRENDSSLKKLVLCSLDDHHDTFVFPTDVDSDQSDHFGLDISESQFARGFSTITALHACGIFPSWTTTAYHGLVDLRLLSTHRSSSIKAAEIRSILHSSPGLRILHFGLEIYDQVPEAEQATPVFLQDLEAVRVLSAGRTWEPLRSSGILRLLAPGQEALRLSLEDHYTHSLPGTLATDLDRFLSRANVVQIHIQRLAIPLSLLRPHLANLECLTISHFDAQFGHKIRAGLAHTDGGYFKSLRVRRSRLSQDDLRALLLYCPAGIVLEGSSVYSGEARGSQGDIIAVWGLGPIGQCVARWAQIKGAKHVIGIDAQPQRLAFAAEKLGIETLNFKEHSDVPKRLHELVPGGVDVALDCGTFHEPKTLLHKAQKTLMLETDVPETANEMIKSVRKMGRCGVIAAYAGYTNQFNMGALMEKGVRLIGNGQAPVHLYWEEILNDYIIAGKFDPTFMITHRVPIDDMAKLYTAFDKRIDGVETVFVETRFSAPPSKGCRTLSRVDEWENPTH
ncbi:Zinc-type alcohol dehydrogenase-like protein C1198,01 [Schizosaccharomyces pombe 972h-] [Rhizoctonia solani]|uniref:Zinc-type alcohol dehydrogenase-like protein C1198,01 [Schizosaccharomyces pombe 972h-] n=1 Tax=Rhizoctonia solani TaxID=456999 RepID=A0A0K6GGG3_9AGAM|nr:Zinc-type alcohol dehydrogenase-like protein C1198,01 [Schizosaccharomyces pombe 972h-] [Rhizoctonia solani]